MRSTKSRKISFRAARVLLALTISCAIFFAQGFAISESAPTTPPLRRILDIKVELKPTELVAPGAVTVTFTIANTSEYDANNLTITSSDGLHTESLGQLGAGKFQVFPRDYTVTQEELDAGQITFIVSHDDIASDGTLVNYTVSAPITKSEARPDIEFTRQISARQVVQGSTVIVTYRAKNTGNVPLTQIRVRDSLGDYSGQIDSLEPGASWILSSRVTIGKTSQSSARVSYVAEAVSGDTQTVELSEESIEVVEEGLSASLALDKSTAASGDKVNGVLTIAATGVDFTGIAVTDDVYGTIIADALELKAGGTLTLSCGWPVRAPSDYRIRVTGVSATGNVLDAVSNTTSVDLTGEFAESALSISATAATPEISRPGSVRVTVAISNTGNAAARNVALSEASMGAIRTFAFIPTGEATKRDVIVDVKEDAQYVFSIYYVDESGKAITMESAPVSVKISSDGVRPEVVNDKDGGFAGWISRNVDDSLTYVWMLGIAGFVLIALTVILIVSHFRERKARRQKIEIEKQRRREELGKTAKFEPVKRPKQPKKRGGTDV